MRELKQRISKAFLLVTQDIFNCTWIELAYRLDILRATCRDIPAVLKKILYVSFVSTLKVKFVFLASFPLM